jgi:Ion channel/Pentapeptide repeats (8 copies)
MFKKTLFKIRETSSYDKHNKDEGLREISTISLVKHKVENQKFDKATGILELGFSDVAYVNCTFKEIQFNYINFSNVIFENCVFQLCDFYNCNIEHESFLEIIGGSIARCIFHGCSLSGIIIKRCRLNWVSFKNVYMSKCNLIKNSYNTVKFIDDCNLVDCVIKGTCCCMNIIFLNERAYTKFSYGSYIGPFNYKDNYYCLRNKSKHPCKKKDLNISNSYMTIGNQYLKNDIQDKYGECFYESKKAKHRTLKGLQRITSSISNFVCGYGEKPFRSFRTSMIVIVTCAILYLFTGVETKDRLIDYNDLSMPNGIGAFFRDLLYCIHFSIVTFATVGYGDLVPNGMPGILIADIEIIMGVIMVAIWTSTLVRKMTR